MPIKTKGEYPDNWKEIATKTKDFWGWKCERCHHKHEVKTGYVLTVHHLDGDKSNCVPWNLACLCQRCHLKFQHKNMFQFYMFTHSEWFEWHVEGFYKALVNGELNKTVENQDKPRGIK